MMNPDQTYAAEQARRAELYYQAELMRQVGETKPQPAALLGRALGRALRRLGAWLEGERREELRPTAKQ